MNNLREAILPIVFCLISLLLGIAIGLNHRTVEPLSPTTSTSTCLRLITHVRSNDEIILLLIARPECGVSLSPIMRDSLGLREAQ